MKPRLLLTACLVSLLTAPPTRAMTYECIYQDSADSQYVCMGVGTDGCERSMTNGDHKLTLYEADPGPHTQKTCNDKIAALNSTAAPASGYCFHTTDKKCVPVSSGTAGHCGDSHTYRDDQLYATKQLCEDANLGIWCYKKEEGQCTPHAQADKIKDLCPTGYIKFTTEADCLGEKAQHGVCAYADGTVKHCLAVNLESGKCPRLYTDYVTTGDRAWELVNGPFDNTTACARNTAKTPAEEARLADLAFTDKLTGASLEDLMPKSTVLQDTQARRPANLINRFLSNYLFPIAASVLLLLVSFGGFQMVSGATSGNSAQTEAGIRRATVAIIGFVLLMMSYAIWRIVLSLLGLS